MEEAPSPALLATAWALRVDRVTAEVVAALDDAGIQSILLKGPVLQRWLYDDGAPRSYTDSDLLVPFTDAEAAGEVLQRIGFTDYSLSGVSGDRPLHARTFARPADTAHVDLHTALIGATVPPAELWTTVSALTEEATVGGGRVRVPTRPVLALHTALHAAQHGALETRPLEDLRRAVARLDLEGWRAATDVALALGALPAFATGLALVPEASEIRRALELDQVEPDAYVRLRATSPPHLAGGFAWLETRGSLTAKLRFALAKLFPPPSFMRGWTPLARRGVLGLVVSYPWRVLWIAWHAPAGFRAWRNARDGR